MHMECKWNANGTQMERTWRANGVNLEYTCISNIMQMEFTWIALGGLFYDEPFLSFSFISNCLLRFYFPLGDFYCFLVVCDLCICARLKDDMLLNPELQVAQVSG